MIRVADEKYLLTNRATLFKELTKILKKQLCFEKKPSFYLSRLMVYVLIHAAMLTLIGLSSNIWLCLLLLSVDVVFILRIGFIGHDLAHGSVANTRVYRNYLGEFIWCFFLGLSKEYWDKKHNLHHRYTNIANEQLGDPDIETPPFILGEQQAQTPRNAMGWLIVQWQHVLYWLTLTLLIVGLSFESFAFILNGKFKNRPLEVASKPWVVITLIVLGYIVNNFALFLDKPVWMVAVLLVYKYLLAGFCIGFVFALNHVGLPTLSGEYPIDRLTLQTYTTRNITGPIGRWFWGVLAYQTEHHLWPSISWHKLPDAAAITKKFCEQHGIIYNEATPWAAFADSTAALKRLAYIGGSH